MNGYCLHCDKHKAAADKARKTLWVRAIIEAGGKMIEARRLYEEWTGEKYEEWKYERY